MAVVAMGALLGIGLGCTIDLTHRIACGDGYVDREAGEECDPQVPESFERACALDTRFGAGVGGCDATTCKVIVNAVQCAFCGDGQVNQHPGDLAESDPDRDASSGGASDDGTTTEECDEDDLDGALCPDGVTKPKCRSDCTLEYDCPTFCGDGVTNGSEECDPSIDDVTNGPRDCAQRIPGVGGVPSPYGTKYVYGSGTTQCDVDTCRWKRAPCSYCGNGERNRELLLDDEDPSISEPAELCDGLDIDDATVLSNFPWDCSELEGGATLRPNVRCDRECGGFEPAPPAEPPCCTRAGAVCPGPDEPQCCSAYLHADDVIPFDSCTPATPLTPSFCR